MRTAILAAGGIIWRARSDTTTIEVLLVHRPRYDDWTFPKGKPHPGEPLLAAAIREVAEETGHSVVVGHQLPAVTYSTADGPKEVTYWVMQHRAGAFVPNAEVDDLCWLGLDEADRVLSYPHDRRLARSLHDLPPAVVRVLLVRHAHAGQRRESDAADIARPLSQRGINNARRLVPLLACFAPTRVLSARALRCVQTVQPLAHTLGLVVEQAPEFGEEEFAADPQSAREVLLSALQTTGAVTVISSQGGVIPALIAGLPATDTQLPPVAAKAGVWALTDDRGRLRADYYPPPDKS